jgi:hypothetical protein
MQTAPGSTAANDQAELPSMLATLSCYESWLGPSHPQTLHLISNIAFVYSRAGEFDRCRPLLERVVRDAGRSYGRHSDLRLRAIAALRDLCLLQHDSQGAAALQQELLECHAQRLGGDHPETVATRSKLAMILLETVTHNPATEV